VSFLLLSWVSLLGFVHVSFSHNLLQRWLLLSRLIFKNIQRMRIVHSILLASLATGAISSCRKEEKLETITNHAGSLNGAQPEIQEISRNIESEKSFVFGGRTYITGFTQRSNNQDAYVICIENNAIIWSRYYDTSTDDSRGEAIITDGTSLFVAFSCTGGNTSFKATSGAFQNSYGSGGGPKILYLTRMKAINGNIEAATFVGGKLNNGKTNTLRLEDGNNAPLSILPGGLLEIKATKAYDRADGRLTPDIGSDADCLISGGGWTGVFSAEMKLLTGNCTAEQ